MGDEEPAEGDLYPEVHLCISCLAENLPTFNFCHDCAAPLHFCASAAPLQSVWAEGWIYRAAVAQPRFNTVIAISLIFGPQVLMALWTLLKAAGDGETFYSELGWLQYPMALIWLAIALGMMLRTAANYAWEDRDLDGGDQGDQGDRN